MKESKKIIILERCESCGAAVDQDKLVWDLEEDRLVCVACYITARIEKRKDH